MRATALVKPFPIHKYERMPRFALHSKSEIHKNNSFPEEEIELIQGTNTQACKSIVVIVRIR